METLSIIAVFGAGIVFYLLGILIEVFAKSSETTIGNDRVLPMLQIFGSLLMFFSGLFFISSGEIVLGGFVGTFGALLMIVSAFKFIPFLRY